MDRESGAASVVSRLPSPVSRPVAGRLIVALDVSTLSEAVELVGELIPTISWFKIGSELFTSTGPDAVAMVRAYGGRVFLDLKYHDIPTTVARAIGASSRMGVAMHNVHVAGGAEMLTAAADANRRASARALLIGVTMLTSVQPAPDAVDSVVKAAVLAQQCGLDGVVASAHEAAAIRSACGADFLVVTPGIRPAASAPDDQRRTATPAQALAAGSDFLVVGRPITGSGDPQGAAEAVLAEMEVASRVGRI